MACVHEKRLDVASIITEALYLYSVLPLLHYVHCIHIKCTPHIVIILSVHLRCKLHFYRTLHRKGKNINRVKSNGFEPQVYAKTTTKTMLIIDVVS